MTPLERAARALAEMDTERDLGWRYYVPEARAVLMAIREPSTEMVADGEQSLRADGYAEFCWQAMIDAAVQEG